MNYHMPIFSSFLNQNHTLIVVEVMGSLHENEFSSSTPPLLTEFNPLDIQEFRSQAHRMVDFIADYYQNIDKYPVLSKVKPGYLKNHLPESAPYRPEPFENILTDIQANIIPGMTHWLSPNFFAFFPATVSSAAFVGEMLCTCFNAVGFNWLASPAATELEMVVMDWLAQLLKLPKSFMFSGSGGGVIQGTTSESILVALLAARDRALAALGSHGITKLVVYGSDQTHCTYTKACKAVGIFPCNIRTIPTTSENDFSLCPVVLRRVIEADVASGLVPLFLCATVGTTSTTAVDPIGQLADVVNDYKVWLHVDAAYGGSACICPEFRHYLDGIERVDSLSLSPHKWLLSYLDCCCLWVKHPSLLVKALTTNPEYLRNKLSELGSVVDYKDWQVGTGRRFKSLRLWMIMRCYGVTNLQSHIRSDIRMAKMFEGLVNSDPWFEVMAPRTFSLVCFRFNPYKESDPAYIKVLNKKLLEAVNSTGRLYMTHTVAGDLFILRFAVGGTLTEDRHVCAAWKLIKESAEALLKRSYYIF